MLAALGRPKLPNMVQRDIRNGKALRPTRTGPERSGGKPSGLLPGWKEAKAPDGRTYYYHAASQKTQWERPQPEEAVIDESLQEVAQHLQDAIPGTEVDAALAAAERQSKAALDEAIEAQADAERVHRASQARVDAIGDAEAPRVVGDAAGGGSGSGGAATTSTASEATEATKAADSKSERRRQVRLT